MQVKLDAELIMELRADCPERLTIGANDYGFLRCIQIAGGSFHGKINGRIVPGGADWNMGFGGEDVDSITSAEVFAKYLLQTDDGVYIAIENFGRKRPGNQPGHIITNPSFHAPKGKYDWLNYGVYVGSLSGSEKNGVRGVDIKIYKML